MSSTNVSTAADKQHASDTLSFTGFEPLDANYLYCPNQFLDICLPHLSRSAIRLVAYMLDQTLGWLDPDGNPRSQSISVSYQQLIDSAGLSRNDPQSDRRSGRCTICPLCPGRRSREGGDGG